MKEGKAYKYAVWCSTEQEGKVPEYVKKQAESWLHIADGNDEDAYVDEQEYEKICKLLKLMVHPDLRCSIYDGLEDYAWFMIVAGLCTYCRNSEQRSRFYVTILLEIARKNFKTFNSAVIFILLMLTEPDFSRFFSVAPDLQLSSELKNAIRKIIKVSPALYDEDEPAFKVLRSQIICLLNENEYTPLAYSQDGMDGKLANAYLADEAGALDDYPVEAMRSSQITLFNKLGIIISTQYPNDNNVMIDEIDIAKKTLDGLLDDRRYFALLYEPDDDLKQGEAWQTDDRAIYQSNPVAVSHQYIFDEIKKKRTLAVLYENKTINDIPYKKTVPYTDLQENEYKDYTAWYEGRPTLYSYCMGLVENLLTSCPTAKIYVVTPMQMWTSTGEQSVGRKQLVTVWENICNKYGLPIVNLWNNSCVNAFNMAEYYPNVGNVHPNNFGYKRIAETIYSKI